MQGITDIFEAAASSDIHARLLLCTMQGITDISEAAASSHRASCSISGGLEVAEVYVIFRPGTARAFVLYGALQITETKRATLTLW